MNLDPLFDSAAGATTNAHHGLTSIAGIALPIDGDEVVVFRGGETLPWSIEEVRP